MLGMGQTRLELAGVELAKAKQTLVRTVLWSLLLALAIAFALLLFCGLLVALAWDSHRYWAIAASVVFYMALAVYFYVRLKATLVSQPPLFDATIAELGRDKQAILDSIRGQHNE